MARLQSAGFDVITPDELVTLVRDTLMVRAGEVIDAKVADERARNVAAALVRTIVK